MSLNLSNGALRSAFIAACALSIVVNAAAQSASQPRASTLDPVVVTAARVSQPIADALADVTVIGADEILRSGVQSLSLIHI